MPAKKTTRKTATRGRKKTARKSTVRKTAAKKITRKKTVTKRAAPTTKKLSAVRKAFTKGEVMTQISTMTDLSRKEVASVFDSLQVIIEGHLRKRSVGEFTLPGLLKCRVIRKPATKARPGINPFTGEETIFKAKPARNVVKIRPLKKLKEMAE